MENSDKRLVVYADDDSDDLGFVSDALAPFSNIELKTFTDGGAILTYLEKLQTLDSFPCLVILDINMPVVNGKEVLFRIRERRHFQELPVILFTTSSFSADQEFARHYGAEFITKPLKLAQMDSLVKKIVSYCSSPLKQE